MLASIPRSGSTWPVSSATRAACLASRAAPARLIRRSAPPGSHFRDDSQPTQQERELMDETRLAARQATTNVRTDARRMWFDSMIRMPVHIAAQAGGRRA
jgi:hypothetical protein